MKRSVFSTAISLSLAAIPALLVLAAPAIAHADEGALKGVVSDTKSGEPIENAVVIIQCSCLQAPKEATTNARGIYQFNELPSGKYTVQVLYGKQDISKVVDLQRGAALRANFGINPDSREKRTITVKSPVPTGTTSATTNVDMEQLKQMPTGGNTSRDFTSAVDLAPTAVRDASGGFSLGGTTSAETKYTVEGASVNNPSFGTVGATIVQEFISDVDILESGYDAEYGGASGGQVQARRVSGTNNVRGEALIRVTPRLAQPRFITRTDESLRASETPDFGIQAVAVVSGPIIKDRLFFTVGVAPSGGRRTLYQQFFSRQDKDGSGGFEECPFTNGDNDCAPGQQYIQTKKFAEQSFKLGNIGFGYVFGLDWSINPRHRLGLTFQGGPGFNQRSFRLPYSTDPNSFGTNPASDPLGGLARVSSGIVNNSFGWDVGFQNLVALNYFGRVAKDKIEIDAGINYGIFSGTEGWRLQDENLRNLPTTQQQVGNGRNLYEFLERDNALSLVPGVEENCNRADLPGLACPTRVWLSGGIGEYGRDRTHQIGGRASLTHFVSLKKAGSMQIKYGGNVEYQQRRLVTQFSGSNDSGFNNNCPAGQSGGGEFCYDPSSDAYSFNNQTTVNNNRFVIVDANNPENQITRGYGIVRKEQDDLRALATTRGEGVRVPRYDETLTTTNYAFFVQDKWAIRSNFYLNFGMRWELQDMRDLFGNQALFIWDNVSPRVGFVYDWTDEGRSRLYGSYGWFFQTLPLQLNSRVFGGLVTVQRTYRQSDCRGQSTQIGGSAFPRFENNQPTEYCVDAPSFTTGLTTGAVVPRLRGQYNQQLQLGYEQEVVEDLVLGFRWLHTDLGRAVEDVSTNGGLNFLIANPGEDVSKSDISAQDAKCDSLTTQLEQADGQDNEPEIARALQQCQFLAQAYRNVNTLFNKPQRNYDAFTFELKKRFAKNWLLIGSYTYSRLVGNYDGFVDPVTGAINIGASTQYDIPDLVRNSYGPLAFNIPHRAKLDGFYTFDLKQAGRLTLGTSFRVQSGLPINAKADNSRYPGQYLVYVLPRGSGGQVEPNYRWDLSLGYAYPLPKSMELEVSARVVNVTNAKAILRVDEIYSYQTTRPISGGDVEDLKHAKVQAQAADQFFSRTILSPQGNYGVETQFQPPLSAQFELKLRF